MTLGTRFAKKPIHLKIPITIAGMSFGALGANAKEAIGRAATAAGTSTTTGDGGMTEEERQSSKTLVYQVLPSRYGMNPDDQIADTVHIDDAAAFLQRLDPPGKLGNHAILARLLHASRLAR